MEALVAQDIGVEVSVALTAGVPGPALALRHLPTQFWRDDRLWQHVIVTLPADCSAHGPPLTDLVSAADRSLPHMTLSTSIGFAEPELEDVRRATSLRYYLPVGTAATLAPALRTDQEPELRMEPKCQVSASISCTFEGPGGRATFDVPLFETLGRLAPRREYRASTWPSMATVKVHAPTPILPRGLERYRALYWAAWEMLLSLARHGSATSGVPGGFISTGSGFPNSQFVWDTAFAAMATRYGAGFFPIHDSLNYLYSRQFDGGYLHREHDVRDGMPILFEPDFSPNPPLLSVAEWEIAKVTGDVVRLTRVYPALRSLHRWIGANRRLPDGTYWTTGLANGLDNSPSLGDGYPDLTAQMAHDAEMLANIAELIGEPKEAEQWRVERATIEQALNRHLWDPVQQIYSTSLPNGGHNPNKVVTAFWPLWADLVPADRVEHLARHLQDPNSFWRHHPIPSLAADSRHFLPEGRYWRGSTWAPTNYAAISGFARAGRRDLARMTSLRHLDCLSEVYEETGHIWENYSCEESAPGSVSMADYCWSALGPINLLIEQVIGIEIDALANCVHWSPPSRERIGMANLPLGNHRVSLLQRKDFEGNWIIEVTTTRRFDLIMRSEDGSTRPISIPFGTSEWATS